MKIWILSKHIIYYIIYINGRPYTIYITEATTATIVTIHNTFFNAFNKDNLYYAIENLLIYFLIHTHECILFFFWGRKWGDLDRFVKTKCVIRGEKNSDKTIKYSGQMALVYHIIVLYCMSGFSYQVVVWTRYLLRFLKEYLTWKTKYDGV